MPPGIAETLITQIEIVSCVVPRYTLNMEKVREVRTCLGTSYADRGD